MHDPLPSWIPAWFATSRRRLWLGLVGLLAALLLLAALIDAAVAQNPCADRDAIAERLAARFGEGPAATGLTDGGALIEVLAAPGGSWTLLLLREPESGIACVVATGQNWRALPPAPGDAGS